LQWDAVDFVFHQRLNNKDFIDLLDEEIIQAEENDTKLGFGPVFDKDLSDYGYNYLHKKASGGNYVIKDDGKKYTFIEDRVGLGGTTAHYRTPTTQVYGYTTVSPSDINPETHRMVINEQKTEDKKYNYIYYYKEEVLEETDLTSKNNNILFAEFENEADAIEHLPKELETVKTTIDPLIKKPYLSCVHFSWDNKNLGDNDAEKPSWDQFISAWQKTYDTAIENVNTQIESVNKSITSLRSKIDTFDTSANRFRDKFYSTIMNVLNKIS
jgi:hypothetical protein